MLVPTTFGRRRVEQDNVQVAIPVTPAAATGTDPVVPARTGQPAFMGELRALCLAQIDASTVANMTPERLNVEVERTLAQIASERRFQLNGREQRDLAAELVHDMLGLGPLEPLLEDETVTDIMVNGPDRVFVERRGKMVMSTAKFRDTMHVANVCQRIAAAIGRRIDESSPMVDARLKDGSRVNIVFMPLA